MIKHIKKVSLLLVILILIFSFSVFTAHAQGILPQYGGLDVGVIPCTCTPGLFWHVFAPLYLTGVPLSGALVAPPAMSFAYYTLQPAAWGLGFYAPGAGVCLIGAPPFCFPLPNLGLVTPFSGTSLPGAL